MVEIKFINSQKNTYYVRKNEKGEIEVNTHIPFGWMSIDEYCRYAGVPEEKKYFEDMNCEIMGMFAEAEEHPDENYFLEIMEEDL